MKINGSFILGLAMIAFSILMEMFWFQTGADSLGVFSLIAALAAAGALDRFIRLNIHPAPISVRS